MNLIINLITLLAVLVYGKRFTDNFSDNKIISNLILVGIIIIANIVYRIITNLIHSKGLVVRDVINESLVRSIIVISGIIAVNFITSNPSLTSSLNFDITRFDTEYGRHILSLVPYLVLRLPMILFAPDI